MLRSKYPPQSAQSKDVVFHEHVVEVPKVIVQHVERIVKVPQAQVVDRIVEVPQVCEALVEGPSNVEYDEVFREVPVVQVSYQPRLVDIPLVDYRDRYIEVPELHEITRRIPRIEVHEVPIEHIVRVRRKVVQEVEQAIYRPAPHMARRPVERDVLTARMQIETREIVSQKPFSAHGQDPRIRLPMPLEGFWRIDGTMDVWRIFANGEAQYNNQPAGPEFRIFEVGAEVGRAFARPDGWCTHCGFVAPTELLWRKPGLADVRWICCDAFGHAVTPHPAGPPSHAIPRRPAVMPALQEPLAPTQRQRKDWCL